MHERPIDVSKPLSYEDAVELQHRKELYYEQMRLTIKARGWMVQGVFPNEPGGLAWAYTIGMLDKFGFELLMFEAPMQAAAMVFNDLGADIKAGKPLKIGTPMDASRWLNDAGVRFKPVRCNEHNHELYSNYVHQACVYHDKRQGGFPVVQILLPDLQGRLPGEPGFDEFNMNLVQPLL